MASANNPKSSAQLIREHSTARYLRVNNGWGSELVAATGIRARALAADAREMQVQKFR